MQTKTKATVVGHIDLGAAERKRKALYYRARAKKPAAARIHEYINVVTYGKLQELKANLPKGEV